MSDPHDEANKRPGAPAFMQMVSGLVQLRYLSIFIGIAAFITIAAPIAVYSIPNARQFVTQEDNLVENLTALAFLITIIGVIVLLAKGAIPHRFRKWLWLIGPIALLGLLDELSFGQRIFNLESLSLRGKGIDAVHDLLLVMVEFLKELATDRAFLLITAGSLLIFIFLAVAWKFRDWISHRLTRSASRECWWMLVLFATLIGISQFLDLEIVTVYRGFAVLIEELFELEAALLLVFILLAVADPFRFYRGERDIRQRDLIDRTGDNDKVADAVGERLR